MRTASSSLLTLVLLAACSGGGDPKTTTTPGDDDDDDVVTGDDDDDTSGDDDDDTSGDDDDDTSGDDDDDTGDDDDDDATGPVDGDGDGFDELVDCDDTDPSVNPGAAEVCDDVDHDCDGSPDNGLVYETYYADADGDGYGDAADSLDTCDGPPTGYVADGTDCDDGNASRTPGLAETCDGVDNDCDTDVDEGVTTAWYADADSDGFGDPASLPVEACAAPKGTVADATDCDDANPAAYPGLAEACDGVDNDCDTDVDEGVTTAWYADVDGDGYGDPGSTPVAACTAPAYTSADATDCDDTTAQRRPGLAEACDGLDNDCDSDVDEGVQTAFYLDDDGDGFGNAFSMPQLACSAPSGDHVTDHSDCDDERTDVYPGAVEVCDLADNDCDTQTDEGVTTPFWPDTDGDGYGDGLASAVQACTAPQGMVGDDTDCDDGAVTTYPGATELCDDADNDCDQVIDDGLQTSWYPDGDGDGFGATSGAVLSCPAVAGHVVSNSDCDDGDGLVFPGSPHLDRCDVVDTDCDGFLEEIVFPTTHATVQGALDAAGPGERVCIDDTVPIGSYTIDESIVVEGVGTRTFSTLSVGSPALRITGGADVELVNLDITDSGDIFFSAGGVVVETGSLLTIRDSYLGRNYGERGGAVHVQTGAQLFVHDSSINANFVADFNQNDDVYGGGIYAAPGSAVQLFDTELWSNDLDCNAGQVARGGAIAVDGAVLSLENVRIHRTDADGCGTVEGAALWVGNGGSVFGHGLDIRDTDVTSSTIVRGGGVYVAASSVFVVDNLIVAGTDVSGATTATGGGLHSDGDVEINFATLYGNSVSSTSASGSALQLDGGNTMLRFFTIEGNDGGAAAVEGSQLGFSEWMNGYANTPMDWAFLPGIEVSYQPSDFVDTTGTDPVAWDLHLQPTSALVDQGMGWFDFDNTDADLGAYGGPLGDW